MFSIGEDLIAEVIGLVRVKDGADDAVLHVYSVNVEILLHGRDLEAGYYFLIPSSRGVVVNPRKVFGYC